MFVIWVVLAGMLIGMGVAIGRSLASGRNKFNIVLNSRLYKFNFPWYCQIDVVGFSTKEDVAEVSRITLEKGSASFVFVVKRLLKHTKCVITFDHIGNFVGEEGVFGAVEVNRRGIREYQFKPRSGGLRGFRAVGSGWK